MPVCADRLIVLITSTAVRFCTVFPCENPIRHLRYCAFCESISVICAYERKNALLMLLIIVMRRSYMLKSAQNANNYDLIHLDATDKHFAMRVNCIDWSILLLSMNRVNTCVALSLAITMNSDCMRSVEMSNVSISFIKKLLIFSFVQLSTLSLSM